MKQTADDISESATSALKALFENIDVGRQEDQQAFATLVFAESQLTVARAIQERNAV